MEAKAGAMELVHCGMPPGIPASAPASSHSEQTQVCQIDHYPVATWSTEDLAGGGGDGRHTRDSLFAAAPGAAVQGAKSTISIHEMPFIPDKSTPERGYR
ncbi:uncharacterized protein IUM83_04139 [Phytophthora cinnamomi]|uniref:uncharacterized protein n=1 Tax=Phytophthora cinnamomi TaxID=4785 RepID=UPI00355996E9|nr:hypothetical protein IUM83_04139 [Phytophthora cinnamomi]